jgi:hypothetical protein
MTFTWSEIPTRTAPEADSSPVSVYVVSTNSDFLRSSLAAARKLTRELSARIEVLAPYVVPYPLDLRHPPIEPGFLERRLLSEHPTLGDVGQVRILLCREEAEAILGALAPKSIVVLAARKRWWKTREDCLAEALGKAGHQVVIAWA